GRLFGSRVAIPRRTAAKDVADVQFLTLPAAGLDDLVEQLTGPAHERFSLSVLVATGSLADEHHPGVGIADAEHRLRPRRRQFGTPLTAGDAFGERLQFGFPLLETQR